VNAHAASSGDALGVIGVVAVVVTSVGVVRVGFGFLDGGLVGGCVVGDLFNFRHLR
jgi:hypothetical protein